MIVYYSIFAYTCLISYIGCYIYRRKLANGPQIDDDAYLIKAEKSISIWWALASVALLVFFVAERNDYNDTASYILLFDDVDTSSKIKEVFSVKDELSSVGFSFLMLFFKKFISTDYHAWFAFLAIFQSGAFVSIYYRFSCNFFMSMYLFISSSMFMWMQGGVRQFTAVCLVLYFLNFVIERRIIGFAIVLYLAYLIHDTVVLWIPIYFIVKFKPFSWQIWICVILTVLAFFFVTEFTSFMDSQLEDTSYAGYGNTITHYENDNGVNPIRFIISAIPPAIALWRWKYIKDRTNPMIDVCINMGTAAAGVNLLGIVTSGILVGRIPIYFTPVNFIVIPWLMKYAFVGKLQKFVIVACYILYFAYFIYDMVIIKNGTYVSDALGLIYYMN